MGKLDLHHFVSTSSSTFHKLGLGPYDDGAAIVADASNCGEWFSRP